MKIIDFTPSVWVWVDVILNLVLGNGDVNEKEAVYRDREWVVE